MNHKYYLKDKKITVWDYTTEIIKGVTKKTYSLKYESIWAYYRHNGGSAGNINSNGVIVYDDSQRVIFVINRRDLNLTDIITYQGKIYEIRSVDNFEGYADDLKIVAEVAKNQNVSAYPGISL